MKLDRLLAKYEGGGASSYHPKLLLKVLLYGYLEGIYSSVVGQDLAREHALYVVIGEPATGLSDIEPFPFFAVKRNDG